MGNADGGDIGTRQPMGTGLDSVEVITPHHDECRVKLIDGVFIVGAWAIELQLAQYAVDNKERIDRERAERLSNTVLYDVGGVNG